MGSIFLGMARATRVRGFSPGYGDHVHTGFEAGWGAFLNVVHRGKLYVIGDHTRYAPVDRQVSLSL